MANQGEEDPASELSLKLLDEELASMEIEAKQLEKEGEMELGMSSMIFYFYTIYAILHIDYFIFYLP